jgi:hypothetical protein
VLLLFLEAYLFHDHVALISIWGFDENGILFKNLCVIGRMTDLAEELLVDV